MFVKQSNAVIFITRSFISYPSNSFPIRGGSESAPRVIVLLVSKSRSISRCGKKCEGEGTDVVDPIGRNIPAIEPSAEFVSKST